MNIQTRFDVDELVGLDITVPEAIPCPVCRGQRTCDVLTESGRAYRVGCPECAGSGTRPNPRPCPRAVVGRVCGIQVDLQKATPNISIVYRVVVGQEVHWKSESSLRPPPTTTVQTDPSLLASSQ